MIIQKKKTHTELAQYLHTACFPPVHSTFLKAIKKNHFKTWPGLTPDILKHLPTSASTVQGHLHQEQQNLQSTNKISNKISEMEATKEHFKRTKEKKNPG